MSEIRHEPEPSSKEKHLAQRAQRLRPGGSLWWLPMWVPIAALGGTVAIAVAVYALLQVDFGI